ncbi:Universal stress protein [Trema orientale]|uniref:Universal stress protein n=1 Tax=Trema orientale TaxID=63057 RepID=A0A2P5F9I3_TREOI|nr:Universal stress protein [Trema orientale]
MDWTERNNTSATANAVLEEEEEISSSEFLEITMNHESSIVLEPMEEEEEEESEGSLFSIDIIKEDRVFVAVGKNDSSMAALLWSLKHAITPSSSVHLIHVFPVLQLVPSPLGGMLPKSQASPKMVEMYLAQQRDKRGKLLQKYIDACSTAKVSVETLLVESDFPAKAILRLIPTLNIRKLVLGSTKSSLGKAKSKRRTASQVLQNAPENCEIKIIYKGKEVIDQSVGSPSSWDTNGNSLSPQGEAIRSPEIIGSPSVGTTISRHIWSVFKWVGTKPTSTFGSTKKTHNKFSGLYENLLN